MSGVDEARRGVERLRAQLERVILGKGQVLRDLLVAVLGGGHVLMEDRPGVGKTAMVKALSRSLSCEFKRIQFTPDLPPTDILGSSVYDPRDGSFRFKEGPIFTNIVLADEINRAAPRTQSALLEAMSEGHVSIERSTLLVSTYAPSVASGSRSLTRESQPMTTAAA